MNETQVSKSTLRSIGLASKHKALALIFDEMARTGITPELLAHRLSWPYKKLDKRIYRGRKLAIEDFSEILFAIGGASPVFGSQPLSKGE